MPIQEEIQETVTKAYEAFLQYRHTPPSAKAIFLEKIAALIDSDRLALAKTANKETSLPAARLEVELNRTIHQLRLFAAMLKEGSWVRAIIDTAEPERKPFPKPDLRQMQQPLGPVAVFGASNFPFAFSVAGGDTVSALSAGCPVIYKINPGHPETSKLVAAIVLDAVHQTKMPDGVFAMLSGTDYRTGIELISHPLIKAVGFTGSLRGGRALFDAAAKREEPIPVYAEMGSVNPVFILPEILAQQKAELAQNLAASNMASVGQFCTNPGIIISEKSPHRSDFLNVFADAIKHTAGAKMLTSGILDNFEKSVKKTAGKKHVEELAVATDDQPGFARARMFETEAKDFLNDIELWEEMFGPESVHVASENMNDMLQIASKLQGQLTVSIWGTENDLKKYHPLLQTLELKAGRMIINGVPTGVEVTAAMNHGGPYPATTDSKFTSVGTQSIYRFTRPVCYQNYPSYLLPEALQDQNPLHIWRMENSEFKK